MRHGILRTRIPATLLTPAAVIPRPGLEAVIDDAFVRGLVSRSQLDRRMKAAGQQGRKGAAALAALLASRTDGHRWTQSEFERRLLALFRRAQLPLPVPQFQVVLPDGRRAFIDFAFPELHLGLEADSYPHHAGRLAWCRDHTRNTLLVSLGWRILPVTWEDLVHTPDDLVALVRRAHAA